MSRETTTPPTPVPALSLERLAVPFGAGAGLVDISLLVESNRRLVVIGPSGAGKTTLLRAIAGLATVREGRVHVAGRDVTELPPERRAVGYLHQQPVLFEHLDVGENVAFALRLRRVPDHAVRAQVADALGAVHLAGFERRAPRTLSGGQRHRVTLARAIAAQPSVLLLDEPLVGLDPSLRDDVRDAIIAAHARTAAAMIVATHDLDDAGALADTVAVLIGGTIVQCAAPATLFARPASLAVARLLGVYQEIPGHVQDDGTVASALGVLPNAPGVAPRSNVVVAFRRGALAVVREPNGARGIAAHVIGVRPRAEETTLLVRLAVPGGSPVLEARNESGDALRPGDACIVALDLSAALVFPA